MKRLYCIPGIFILLMAFLLPGCAGKANQIEASPGKEFSIGVGQTASIESENLTITLKDVPDDSRCPRNVECVWAGMASCMVQITYLDTASNIVLVQPGGSISEKAVFKDYEISFNLKPYPESLTEISKSDYLLYMTVKKAENQEQE